MFKIIQRYLAATFVPPFFLSVIFFVAFLLTFQLFRIMKVVINKGVEFTTLMGLVLDLALSFLPMAVPLSVLFAMLYTMNKMSEDSEVIAMRSFGFSKNKLFLPFLIMGLFIALAIFGLNRNIIPISYKQFTNTVMMLSSKGTMTDIKSETFFTDIPNVTLFAGHVNGANKKMDNVFIHYKSADETVERIIFAQKGHIFREDNYEKGMPQLRMRLTKGNMLKLEKNNRDVEKINFEEYDYPLYNRDTSPDYIVKDSMRTNSELWQIIKEQKALGKDKELVKMELEFWSRINTPFLCLIFILLGFTLGVKRARGKSGNTGVIVLMVLVCYYAFFFLGVSLAKKGVLSVLVATFMPTVLALIVGLYFYRKLDWVS